MICFNYRKEARLITVIRTYKVKLYPNRTMTKVLDSLCDYRRYCWNLGLATWNEMYDSYTILEDKKLRPSEYKVRNELVDNKQDWQYELSSRVLQQATSDLGKAWSNYLNKALPNWGRPKFKSKKAPRQGFKTDRARLVDNKLLLDRPHNSSIPKNDWKPIKFKGYSNLTRKLKTVSIYKENGNYYASLPIEVTIKDKPKTNTNTNTAIDLNVGHINYTDGKINTLPKKLSFYYDRIKHYQRLLAKKRVVNKGNYLSNNYVKTRTKLQRDYRKVSNIQHDIIQKFTTNLVNNYDKIVIEDLDVSKMKMSHVASKGLQRSLFSYFRTTLEYKCNWYNKELIIAPKYYPSTQRCSNCGFIKKNDEKITLQGNQKHKTKHNEYICYECGFKEDRDINAVNNLLQLIK